MASTSVFSDSFESALGELLDKLRFNDTGLLEGVKRLFRPKIKNPVSSSDLLRLTSELMYWNRLKKLLISVDKCSDAHKVVENWGSLVIKIEAAFNERAKDFRLVSQNKNISKRPLEALDVLSDAEKEFGLFKQAIGEALNNLSSSSCSLEWRIPLLARSLCSEFLFSIMTFIYCIWDDGEYDDDDGYGFGCSKIEGDLKKKIQSFGKYKVGPLYEFLENALPVHDVDYGFPGDHMTEKFVTHIAFVAVRIAHQSFGYWMNRVVDSVDAAKSKIIRLLDLQHEINLLSPQFLELNLKFVTAVNKTRPGRSEDLVSSFLNFALCRGRFTHDIQKKLEPLIIFVSNESEEPTTEDVQGYFAQITAMLLMVMSSITHDQLHLSPELDTIICLLNVEVFLKQKLNSSTISLESKVEAIVQLLKYLRSLSHLPDQKIEDGKQAFMLVDEVDTELASLYQSLSEKKIREDRVRISLSVLLLKIVIFKAELSCMEFLKFLNGNASMMDLGKDQTVTLLEGLKLFSAFVKKQQEEAMNLTDMELIFTHIETNARGITSIYYSFIVDNITEEAIKKMILSRSDLLHKMTIIKAELREICPRFSRSNFPKVHGMATINFLQEKLPELLKHCPDSLSLLTHQVERIQLDLESLTSFLMKVDTQHLEFKDLGTHVTDVVYEAECIIDSIEVGIGDHWQHFLWFHDLLEEIRLIKIQATKIQEEKTFDASAHNVAHISSHKISQVSRPEIGEHVVCLSREEEAIVDRLTRGSSQQDIVSIVGMPGIGKTTLAEKVYNDTRVTFHFHIRAWCSVSQGYEKRELLLDILSDIIGLTDDIHQMTDEDLDLKLYQSLKQRRYLIVLDDVWDNGALDALERSLPNDANGSRILMTSRLHDVALKAKPDSDPHSLRLLSDDESWKLLQMKIFHAGCPKELSEVGKEIAKNCKGLPLAIVAIAGLLERTEKKLDIWKRFVESLSSRIIDDPQTRCMDILQLSYNHLPGYLKPCFLYFGAFLEDKDIPVSKLIRLWIAEGFIQKTMSKSSEDLAEDYLLDLIGRSLVTVSKIGSRGRVKACRIHDLLCDLCLSKAKEENFLQLITAYDEPYSSLCDLDYGADFVDHYPSNPVTYETHRLCFCLKRKHFVKSSPYGPCARSVIFFATTDTYPRRPYDISFIPRQFKLVKVLDLESINMGASFPKGIELLVRLRYLAVSGDIDLIPPSIANLKKLETLIVKGLKGKVILPDSIWCMGRLRHLHVNEHVDFNLLDDKLESSLQLVNLVSFSLPSLSYGKHTENIMRRFPNLRKLRCIFLESWDPSRNYNRFPELDILIQLESLKIFYFGRVLNAGGFILPWNLKKLTLSNFRLPWVHISSVGRLENLEVLKLLSRAFEGERWDMREGEFLKLKYLKFNTLNIAKWNASSDHLPNLQQLVLQNCKDLEVVPYDFREIPTLLRIEVQSCRRSAEESVTNIAEEGIVGLKIIINHKLQD